jgi:hypothetical protein
VDTAEALAVAESHLAALRALSYDDLVSRYLDNEPEWETAEGRSGVVYELQIMAHWDEPTKQTLRVWVNADDETDEGFRRPVSTCFIIAPDGSFIGE